MQPCPQCGAPVPPAARACGGCGAPMSVAVPASGGSGLKIVGCFTLAGLAVAGFAIASLYFYFKSQKPSGPGGSEPAGKIEVERTASVKSADGGEVKFDGTGSALDRFKMKVPAGAIQGQESVNFKVGVASTPPPVFAAPVGDPNELPEAVGAMIRVEPDKAVTLKRPAEVTVPYDPEKLPPGLRPEQLFVLVVSTDAQGKKKYELIAPRSARDQVLVIELGHFSDLTPLAQQGAEGLGKKVVKEILKAAGVPGVDIADKIDKIGVGPITKYFTTPDSESAQAAVIKLIEGIAKMKFSALGLVLDGGRVIIGESVILVKEAIDAGHQEQVEAAIFGSSGSPLASINNLLGQAPFFTSGPVTNRGITLDNIGSKVKTEQELNDLFFKYYRNEVKDVLGSQVDDQLREAWPLLLKYWRAKRVKPALEEMIAAGERAAREYRELLKKRRATLSEDPDRDPALKDWVIYSEEFWLHVGTRAEFKTVKPKSSVLWCGTSKDPAKKGLLAEGFDTHEKAIQALVKDLTELTCEFKGRDEVITAKYKETKYSLWLDRGDKSEFTTDFAYGMWYGGLSNVFVLRPANPAISAKKKFGKQWLVHATGHGTMDGPRKDDVWMMIGGEPDHAHHSFLLPDGMGGTFGYSYDKEFGPFTDNFTLIPILRQVKCDGVYLAGGGDHLIVVSEIPSDAAPVDHGP